MECTELFKPLLAQLQWQKHQSTSFSSFLFPPQLPHSSASANKNMAALSVWVTANVYFATEPSKAVMSPHLRVLPPTNGGSTAAATWWTMKPLVRCWANDPLIFPENETDVESSLIETTWNMAVQCVCHRPNSHAHFQATVGYFHSLWE